MRWLMDQVADVVRTSRAWVRLRPQMVDVIHCLRQECPGVIDERNPDGTNMSGPSVGAVPSHRALSNLPAWSSSWRERRVRPLAERVHDQDHPFRQRLHMLVHSSGLDLSSPHRFVLAARIRERRRAIGSRWRRLSRADRPCSASPTCATRIPTPSSPPGSTSARPRPTATSPKPSIRLPARHHPLVTGKLLRRRTPGLRVGRVVPVGRGGRGLPDAPADPDHTLRRGQGLGHGGEDERRPAVPHRSPVHTHAGRRLRHPGPVAASAHVP